MKVVVILPLLVLSNLLVASAAGAKDTNEALRDHLAFCSQFIIHDPDAGIVLNRMRDCCAFETAECTIGAPSSVGRSKAPTLSQPLSLRRGRPMRRPREARFPQVLCAGRVLRRHPGEV